MSAPRPPSAQSSRGNMLFLIGHALQTPLSAIRWGSARLQKMTKGTLSEEQERVLESIAGEAKILSGMLHALLLVSRIEEGTYPARPREIYLRDFLLTYPPLQQAFPGAEPTVTCPDHLLIKADRAAVECLFQAISLIVGTAALVPGPLQIDVDEESDGVSVTILPAVELSVLREAPAHNDDPSGQLVGGVAGLMLSVATSLCSFLGGSLELRERGERERTLRVALPLVVPASVPAPALS